jgi:hypothetical protein
LKLLRSLLFKNSITRFGASRDAAYHFERRATVKDRNIAKRMGLKHAMVQHGIKEYVRGDAHTNTIEPAFSLFERGLRGSWHKLSAKHMQAYLEEMSFRFNRRDNSDLFVDTLRQMITAPVLTYERLTA